MKQLLVITVIAAFVFACGNKTEGDQSASNSTTPAAGEPAVAAADGEKAYKQYCVTCHGLYGDMGASGAANLSTSTISDEERLKVITEGRTGTAMVGFKTILKEDQIKAVAEYTKTLKK
ncbi:MAG: c-type cytochrome [Saprospiraceae bacterium]